MLDEDTPRARLEVWPPSSSGTYGPAMAMVSGLLLTGGRSRRLGADKARLVLDGETLARRMAAPPGRRLRPRVEVGPGLTGLPVR